MLEPAQLRARLRELDDPEFREFPRGYDNDTAKRMFARLTGALRERFEGAKGPGEGQAQDASYHADIGVPGAAAAAGLALWVRMSNFGGLVTAGAEVSGLGEADRYMDPRDAALVDAACAAAGCLYVPLGLLLEPYEGPTWLDEPLPDELLEPDDGTAEPAGDEDVGPVWFNRFFDYM